MQIRQAVKENCLIRVRLLLVTWKGEKRTLSCCVLQLNNFKKRSDTFYRIFNR